MFTDIQKRFLELESKREEYKKYKQDLQLAIAAIIEEQGLDSYFQAADGTVFKFTECEGKFVVFDKYSYCRTKRAGEERGTLSLKEAKEHGFKVD